MQSSAKTVDEYLQSLPEDRREALSTVRQTILKHLNPGFEEGMQYGMIGYYVPHTLYPNGYHCDPKQPLPFACLASQKNYMSLYLLSSYGSEDEEQWLHREFAKAGKRLDMGKSCIRFKKLEDLPLKVVGDAFRRIKVADYIKTYEASIPAKQRTSTAGKAVKSAANKSPSKVVKATRKKS